MDDQFNINKIMFVLFFLYFFELPAHGASIDCNKALTSFEKTICSDAGLSLLDDKLAAAFKKRLLRTNNSKDIEADQQRWLRFYERANDPEMLKEVYENRIEQLDNDACSFFLENRFNVKSEEFRKNIVGHDLGAVGAPKNKHRATITIEELEKMGLSAQEEKFQYLLNSPYGVRASLVDIDGDGIDELRLYQIGGSLHCMRSYLFKKDTQGRYRPLSGEGYEDLAEETRFCKGELLFIKYYGQVYLIEAYEDAGIRGVWTGTNKELQKTCRFNYYGIKRY